MDGLWFSACQKGLELLFNILSNRDLGQWWWGLLPQGQSIHHSKVQSKQLAQGSVKHTPVAHRPPWTLLLDSKALAATSSTHKCDQTNSVKTKDYKFVTQQAQAYIVLAQEGAESWFERVPLRNTNSHQIAGNFFPLDGAQIVVELEWILGSRKQKTLFRSTWAGRLEWQPRIECSIVCALIEKGPTLYAAYMTLLTADLQLMYINGGQKTNLWQR